MDRARIVFLLLVAAIFLWVGAGLADVIFDSYPKSVGGGYGFSGPNCILTGYNEFDEAQRFVVPESSDYTLDHLVLALEWRYGSYRGVDVCVMSGAVGDTVPDVVLACAPTFNIDVDDPVDVDVYIPDCPVLEAGTAYWIACSTLQNAYFNWSMSTGTWGYRASRSNGGPWGFQYTKISAFQVHATPAATAVDGGTILSADLSLRCSPNPFNPGTIISFDLQEAGRVRLTIYDVQGRLVRTLVDAPREPGRKSHFWDGRAEDGSELPSGVYFYQLETLGHNEMKKAVLLK
jgi:hypothetical protein